jgi:hypothetical protein
MQIGTGEDKYHRGLYPYIGEWIKVITGLDMAL